MQDDQNEKKVEDEQIVHSEHSNQQEKSTPEKVFNILVSIVVCVLLVAIVAVFTVSQKNKAEIEKSAGLGQVTSSNIYSSSNSNTQEDASQEEDVSQDDGSQETMISGSDEQLSANDQGEAVTSKLGNSDKIESSNIDQSTAITAVSDAMTNDRELVANLSIDKLAYSIILEEVQGFAQGLYGVPNISNQYQITGELNPNYKYVYMEKLEPIAYDKYLSDEEKEIVETELIAYDSDGQEYAVLQRPLLDYETLLAAGYGTTYFGNSGDNIFVGTWPEINSDEITISNRIAQNLCAETEGCTQIDDLVGTTIEIPLIAYDEEAKEYTATLTATISGIYYGLQYYNDIILAASDQ